MEAAAAARRPETAAWIVLTSAFATFCLIVAALIWGALWYRSTATISHPATLTVIGGTVLVGGEGQAAWVGATSQAPLKEGQAIKTDETAQAFVTFFDHSTALVFSGTELTLSQMASYRFAPQRQAISLTLTRGKMRLGIAPPWERQREFRVATPQGALALEEGSFSVKVDSDSTQLWAQERGRATAVAGLEEVRVEARQKTELIGGQAPSPPQPAQEELVSNGDFSQGLMGWHVGHLPGFPEGQDIVGETGLILEEGQPAVRFSRQGSKGTHDENYIFQEIDKDISHFSSLRLSVKLKLLHQSLSGGGYVGSEYPIMLRVSYRAVDGESFIVYGFYYQNQAQNRTDNGTPVAADTWVSYLVPDNLMALSPQPRRIVSLMVSASGWDYDSLVREVSLVGE